MQKKEEDYFLDIIRAKGFAKVSSISRSNQSIKMSLPIFLRY